MSEVNKTTGKDILYAAGKAVVGSIPIVGSAASELFGLLITPPLEKRREEWMKQVGEDLERLRDNCEINLDVLSQNEQFLDTVLHATSLALKTSIEEKKQAFRNVIINTAKGEAPEQSKAHVFLNYLDSFTEWHIRILDFINAPAYQFQSRNIQPPKPNLTSLFQVITAIHEELKCHEEFVLIIWADLQRAGFHNIPHLTDMLSWNGTLEKRTTQLGEEFIKFISQKEE